MNIETLPIGKLRPAPYNPREISPESLGRLERSMTEFGLVEPIIVNKRTGYTVVGGHQRLEILRKQGVQKIECSVVDLPLSREKALNVALNNQAMAGAYDFSKLADLLQEIDTGEFDVSTLTGFDVAELERIANYVPASGKEETEPVPELPKKAVSKLGDMWEMGKHRLMCGDSTKDLGGLVGDAVVASVVTDPPYGTNQPGVPGDSPDELRPLLDGTLGAMPIKDSVVVAFQSPRTFPVWLELSRAHGHKFERMLWLYKQAQCVKPWRGWLLKSEAILVSSVGKGKWQDVHPYQHDCYLLPEVSGEIKDAEGWHGSIKPLVVVSDLVSRVTPNGGVCLDPFLGSGTTLIAAERLGRRCYGMELEPKYVDVAVKRFMNFAPGATIKCSRAGAVDAIRKTMR